MQLYDYFRSSAAYRVRIALNLKALRYQSIPVHLVRGGGEHKSASYAAINPHKRVPALALSSGDTIIQSLAIIEYLDEVHPEPPLLPADAIARARVRSVAQIVACDIHPLNNSGTMAYLRDPLLQDKAAIDGWYAHWVGNGFQAIEALIAPGPYAFGAQVSLADVCIVPQLYNARRFNVPLDPFPKIVAAANACLKLPAFDKAAPEKQADAE